MDIIAAENEQLPFFETGLREMNKQLNPDKKDQEQILAEFITDVSKTSQRLKKTEKDVSSIEELLNIFQKGSTE